MGLGWLLVLAVMLGSLLPGPGTIDFDIDDKILHFMSYFSLMVWFAGMYERNRQYLMIAIILVALGIALDVMQGFVATRFFDVFDIVANIAGTVTGYGLVLLMLGGWCRRVERLILR